MSTLALLCCLPLLAMLAAAAAEDLRSRRIPNQITLAMVLCGLAAAVLAPAPLTDLSGSLLGLLAGLGLGLAMLAIGAWGGGDAKLLAAVGTWLGAGGVVVVFAASAVAGLVLMLAIAARARRLREVAANGTVLAAHFAAIGRIGAQGVRDAGENYRTPLSPLPYAVAVLLATAALVVWNWALPSLI